MLSGLWVSGTLPLVNIDGWAVGAATCAALSMLMAISPPVGDANDLRGMRVEIAEGPFRGRPWLIRATLEDARSELFLPLSEGEARVASGALVVAAPLRRMQGSPWSIANVPSIDANHVTLVVQVGNRAARWEGALPVAGRPVAEPRGEDSMEARVVEGALLPGVAGTLLVRAQGAREVVFDGGLDQVEVTPSLASVDACGIARTRVISHALGAPLSITAQGPGVSPRPWRTRLPVRAGGAIALRSTEGVFARTASADGMVWNVTGDALGVLRWGAASARRDGELGRAEVVIGADARWLLLARGADLADGVVVGIRGEAARGCGATPLGVQWASLEVPALPTVSPRLIFDGR